MWILISLDGAFAEKKSSPQDIRTGATRSSLISDTKSSAAVNAFKKVSAEPVIVRQQR